MLKLVGNLWLFCEICALIVMICIMEMVEIKHNYRCNKLSVIKSYEKFMKDQGRYNLLILFMLIKFIRSFREFMWCFTNTRDKEINMIK